MKFLKLTACIILLNTIIYCSAQQNNFWYFGKQAGLNFNSLPNQPIPSILVNSAMNADEGCATVSDSLGNLIFYTNGVTIYNRQHATMLNGNNLSGNISACQSSLIVPVPGSPTLFYVFTTDAVENGFANGYRYSIVDMFLDNGDGAVVSKNILLWSSCTERLSAVRHQNGVDVWIVTNDRNSNIFRSWLLTCNGLEPNAVVSTVGTVIDQHYSANTGYIKFSPDGKKMCQTHFPYFDEFLHIPNFFQLFDFDNATGVISNTRSISFPDAQYNYCEFSPDSKLLYVTRPNDKAIDQFEITLPTVTDIQNSRIVLNTRTRFHGIQLAPDEKIYTVTPSFFMGCINQPNIKGTGCNMNEIQLDLTKLSFLGLPSMINDVTDVTNGFSYTIIDTCSGIVKFQGQSTMPGILSWYWDFGDGFISNQQNPLHQFNSNNEIYTVKLKITSSLLCGGSISKSRIIRPRGIATDIDFSFVNNCDSGYVRFINQTPNIQNLGGQYTWYFGDGSSSQLQDPIHSYSQPGSYTVKLKLNSSLSCQADSMEATIDVKNFSVTVSPEQTILVGQSVQLYANGLSVAAYKWTPGTSLNNTSISNPVASPLQDIIYKVHAVDSNGCVSEDSVKVKVIQYNDFYVPSAFTPNNDGKNDIIRPFFHGKYILLEFSVFNRWGGKVFTTSERGEGWNGYFKNKLQATDVYVWIIRAVDQHQKPIEIKGSFVLIR